MKTAGVIAEYNPFHNGHQFHLEETRRRTGADFVIVVLSGDFVQRGAPSLLDKYDRARMALTHGADLVFELPVTAALSSAEGFATGGVFLLDGLGVVDAVSCGCESADADPRLFSLVVSLLADEPEAYRNALSSSLKAGNSFPKAREQAVRAVLGEQAEGPGTDELARLLSEPNNILAVEYARALRKRGSSMELFRIPRQGSGSHGEDLSENCASASAIRRLLLSDDPDPDAALGRVVPADLCASLLEARRAHRLLGEDDFSDLLFYALTDNRDRLGAYGTENSDLANRTAKMTEQFTDWSGFTKCLKTKNQTYTAISRYLSQILLGIRRDDLALAAGFGFAPYARLLGFRREAAPLLKTIHENASIPILSRPAREYPGLGEEKRRLFELDLRAAEIYRQVLQSRSGMPVRSELRQPVLTVEN